MGWTNFYCRVVMPLSPEKGKFPFEWENITIDTQVTENKKKSLVQMFVCQSVLPPYHSRLSNFMNGSWKV